MTSIVRFIDDEVLGEEQLLERPLGNLSSAGYSGKQLGGMLELGGPIVAFLLVAFSDSF
jgi:hypothetical protein